MNKKFLTDRISDLLSCPTETAIDNLKKEGFDNLPVLIEKHGDIMKDAVVYYSQFSANKSSIIKDQKLEKNEFVLATIHRQENTEDITKLTAIFKALEKIHKTQTVILPIHPRTSAILKKLEIHPKIQFIDPVGYYDMLELLKNCSMVITDSGGLQKEAFFNKKQCIVVREETEWLELVAYGFAKVVGSNTKKILQTFEIAFQKAFNESSDGFFHGILSVGRRLDGIRKALMVGQIATAVRNLESQTFKQGISVLQETVEKAFQIVFKKIFPRAVVIKRATSPLNTLGGFARIFKQFKYILL